MSRDEYPCIRYRRREDYSMESRRFISAADFASAGGYPAGWAASPKDVAREPHKMKAAPVAPPAEPVKTKRKAKA
jgi:hypothetical protein